MSSKFRQLELVHDDSVYLVVGRHAVADVPDHTTARAFVHHLARIGSPLELEWLAAELTPFPPRSFEEALEIIADAIVRGTLVAVRHEGHARLLDDEMEEIEDLVDPTAKDDPWVPIDPRPVEPDLTWSSFEVVDDRGHRLDGAYVCRIDARPDEGPLAKEEHHYEELRWGARAELELRFLDLFVDDETDEEAITPTVPDDSASPETETATSFEVVDTDGRPFVGDYVVFHKGSEAASGSLGGRTEIDATLTGSLTLELSALTPASLARE